MHGGIFPTIPLKYSQSGHISALPHCERCKGVSVTEQFLFNQMTYHTNEWRLF